MTKPKLLLVTNGFPFGNSERGFLTTEYGELEERFDVYIAAHIPCPPAEEWEGVDRSRVFCTGGKKLRPLPVLAQVFRGQVLRELDRIEKGRGLKLWLRRAALVLRYSARAAQFESAVSKLVSREKIDMIYTYWCTQATVAAIRLKEKHPGLRVVTRFHGYDLYNERQPELLQPFRQDIARQCDRLFFTCCAGEDYFRSHWSVPEERCMVAYLGCPPLRPVPFSPSETLVLVSCSNMIPLKRIGLIIDALALLPADVKVDWHHFGDGICRPELERQAKAVLTGRRNVTWTFHGVVANTQLNSLYEQLRAGLFISASSTEGGAPVSIQEALAMGIPAIATAVGGTPELVVTGRTGYLLPETPSPRQVADTIEGFIRLPEESRRAMTAAALALWHEKCDAGKNALRFVQTLEQILSHSEDPL